MCLGVPGKIIDIKGNLGKMELGGVIKDVDLRLIEDISIGDYVLIHAGFAIEKLNEEEALETISLLREMLSVTMEETEFSS